MQSHLQVGHHCFQVLRKSTIKMVSFQLHYSIWGKAIREGSSQTCLDDVLRDGHPNPKQSLCLPSIVEITHDSMHPKFSGYYSVCLKLLTHRLMLYPYQSSILTHQDNPLMTQWHITGACNHCTLHTDILLNATSNSGRSQHI